MHGLIFLQLQKFAQKNLEPGTWEKLLFEAGLAGKTFLPVRAYPDGQAVALVDAASRLLGQSQGEVLEAFGAFLAPELLKMHGRLLHPGWKTLDVLEHTENLIHAAVRVGNPGAQPPVLECVRTGPDEVQLIYSSERQMCSLAKGIVRGLAGHFGEKIEISDQACMQRGDPYCSLGFTRTAGPVDSGPKENCTEGQEHLSFSTSGFHDDGEATVVLGNGGNLFSGSRKKAMLYTRLAETGGIFGSRQQYRLVRKVGEGGMGIVFQAEDTLLNRTVALKLMQPELAFHDGMRQRLIREARALASLRSDHVVSVYEAGEGLGIPYLAMEFLEGETLDRLVNRAGPPPFAEVLRIGRETCAGLGAAHARGLIHRDIKPVNLWLEAPGGRVKLLDFGLARVAGENSALSRTGAILGTQGFVSPEQARGEEVDHRSDLFSLGCVLYWLCTGYHPFRGKDLLGSLTALATVDPDPVATFRPGFPDEVSELVMELLKKDRALRPQTAMAVSDRLTVLERQLQQG